MLYCAIRLFLAVASGGYRSLTIGRISMSVALSFEDALCVFAGDLARFLDGQIEVSNDRRGVWTRCRIQDINISDSCVVVTAVQGMTNKGCFERPLWQTMRTARDGYPEYRFDPSRFDITSTLDGGYVLNPRSSEGTDDKIIFILKRERGPQPLIAITA